MAIDVESNIAQRKKEKTRRRTSGAGKPNSIIKEGGAKPPVDVLKTIIHVEEKICLPNRTFLQLRQS